MRSEMYPLRDFAAQGEGVELIHYVVHPQIEPTGKAIKDRLHNLLLTIALHRRDYAAALRPAGRTVLLAILSAVICLHAR